MRFLASRIQALLAAFLLVPFSACDRPSKEEIKRQKKANQAESARAERSSVLRFASAMREVVEWKSSQPVPGSEAEQRRLLADLAARMEAVPVKNLPEDVATPWRELLPAYRALATTPALDPQVRERASQAAAQLNRALAARGIIDLHL